MDSVHVDQPWVEVAIKQNVAGLKIAMNEATVVHASKHAGGTFHDAPRTGLGAHNCREGLRAGDLITTGAWALMPVPAGARICVAFDGIGAAEVTV